MNDLVSIHVRLQEDSKKDGIQMSENCAFNKRPHNPPEHKLKNHAKQYSDLIMLNPRLLIAKCHNHLKWRN